MATREVRVVFRGSNEKLSSMFSKKFSSVAEAKRAIEADAHVWCILHSGEMCWRDPCKEDYLEAVSGDKKLVCTWQYFADR